jgi:tetratricopeptide (TPR) repeat protein
VAGVIEPRVQSAETQRASSRPTDHMGSYDLYLRALSLYRTAEPETTTQALEMLERAEALDPTHGLALALAAMCHRDIALNGWSGEPERHRRLAVELADRALRAAGDDAEVLAFAAAVLGALDGDADAVLALFDRALALNPGSSTAWLSSGMMRLRVGDAVLAAEHLETSMRLDPLSPLRGRQLLGVGSARFAQQRFVEAAAALREAARLLPTSSAYPLLIACHGHLDQAEEASHALVRWASLGVGDLSDHARRLPNADLRRLCEAGLARVPRPSPSLSA